MRTLKYLLLVAVAAVAFTACQSTKDQGRPGDESGVRPDGKTNVVHRNPGLNLRDGWNH
jgi:hypothetical protein